MSTQNKRRLSKQLKKDIIQFLETHSPAEFSRNIRYVLLDYLQQNIEALPICMEDFLFTLNNFFELLDAANNETKEWNCVDHKS